MRERLQTIGSSWKKGERERELKKRRAKKIVKRELQFFFSFCPLPPLQSMMGTCMLTEN